MNIMSHCDKSVALTRHLTLLTWLYYILGIAKLISGVVIFIGSGLALIGFSGMGTANLGALPDMIALGLGVVLIAGSLAYFKVARLFKSAKKGFLAPALQPFVVAIILGSLACAPIAIPLGLYALYVRSRWAFHLKTSRHLKTAGR